MERIAALLPVGRGDAHHHRGARRAAQRFELNAEVAFLAPESGSGVVLNASAGGLRVAVDRHVPVAELCVVEVRFTPERQSVEHCRVVWSRPLPDGWVLGLEFAEVH